VPGASNTCIEEFLGMYGTGLPPWGGVSLADFAASMKSGEQAEIKKIIASLAGPVPDGPMEGPQQATFGERFDLSILNEVNTELADASELMGDWNRSTEDMDSTLTDFAQNGLNATQGAFTSFFDSMVKGTASTSDAVRSMVSDILSSLARLAMNQLFTQIAGAVIGAAGSTASSGTATAQPVSYAKYPMADGGVVNKPTFALIGEAGPEAVIPLNRLGGGSGGTQINLTINPSAGMDERAVGEIAAASVMRKLRESRGFRAVVRGHAKGGLL